MYVFCDSFRKDGLCYSNFFCNSWHSSFMAKLLHKIFVLCRQAVFLHAVLNKMLNMKKCAAVLELSLDMETSISKNQKKI